MRRGQCRQPPLTQVEGFLEREACLGLGRGGGSVLCGGLCRTQRRRLDEVVRQLHKPAVWLPAHQSLEGFANATVDADASAGRYLPIDDVAHDGVGEGESIDGPDALVYEMGAERLLHGLECKLLGEAGHLGEQLEVELTANYCGESEDLLRVVAEAGHPMSDHLAHARGQAQRTLSCGGDPAAVV